MVEQYSAGKTKAGAIKLSSNESSYGISHRLTQILIEELNTIHRYPDSSHDDLKEKIAEYLVLHKDQIIFGNGSDEIITFICNRFLSTSDYTLSAKETFSVYKIATQIAQGQYKSIPLKKGYFDMKTILSKIPLLSPKLIFICNPNNPTGTYIPSEELKSYITQIPEDIFVILDEAYIDFVDEEASHIGLEEKLSWHPKLIILRTFSKLFALGGIRIGMGISHQNIINTLSEMRMPFNVNSIAQSAVRHSLDEIDHLQHIRDSIIKERQELLQFARDIGYTVFPSQANFIAYKMSTSKNNDHNTSIAEVAYDFFARYNVIVRSLHSFSMDDYIRITIGKREENKIVKQILKSWLSH